MFDPLGAGSDVLGQVLAAVHLGGALAARTELRAPWALHLDDAKQRAGFHVVADGACWARLDGDDAPVPLRAGDVILFPHGAGHTLGDHPDSPAVEFAELVAGSRDGVVTVPSGALGAPTTLLCGSYSFTAEGASPLLRGLPPLLHVPADRRGPLSAAVDLLIAEARDGGQGALVVVDRLVDLLFVYALRAWLDNHGDDGHSSWFGALHDPVVGPALQTIHDDPAHGWTVAVLARRSGLSRAPFARRFRDLVGEPPMAYLTRWRMSVAADLLTDGGRVNAVAQQVGYDNEFAFAKAFKRVCGVPPGQVRRRAAAAIAR